MQSSSIKAREQPAAFTPPAAVVVDLDKARFRYWSDLLEAVGHRGDSGAYERLYRHFAPRLRMRGIARGLRPAIADDVVQETLLSVWQHAGQYKRTRGAASTWIYTIFRNKCIDSVRREPRNEIDIDGVKEQVGGEEDIADRTDRRVLAAVGLRRAMATLSREQRLVVDKAFFEDKSHSEVAEELALPLGTVKSRIRLSLARIRDGLAN